MKATAILRALAREAGIQLAYRDISGQRHVAQPEQLIAVLQALGLPIAHPGEAPALLRALRWRRLQRRCEPVQVVRYGQRRSHLRLLVATPPHGAWTVQIRREDGQVETYAVPADILRVTMRPAPDSVDEEIAAVTVRLPLPSELPVGYHEVTVRGPDGVESRTLLMVRPPAVLLPATIGLERSWGVFLPLYAAWRERPDDGATYSRLAELASWIHRRGGALVGTLPLLPVFLSDDPFDPSPYAPVSRLFWNEFYSDVTALPEGSDLDTPLVTVASETGALLVDYATTWRSRRAALATVSERLRADPGRWAALTQWADQQPEVHRYARFRAAVDRYGPPSRWPAALHQDRTLDTSDLETDARLYLVGQWLASQQVAATRAVLYADLPLGVHPEGFDVWRWPHLFVTGVSAGAPPDPFFAGGQVWGFPPLHPERIREDGYRYVRAVLAHHLRAARLLRIDHVMGFHRLYWVPAGASGRDGLYVRYRPDEFYAVLAIESHRAGCAVAGEDLGTVPAAVRRAMATNGLLRLWVLPFERRNGGFSDPPALAVANMDTHDLPPFAALWDEWSPAVREAVAAWLHERGLLEPAEDADPLPAVTAALLRLLGSSPAAVVVVNVEDLWFEREPQNQPGTGLERPNWRRLARRGLAAITTDLEIAAFLTQLDRARKGGEP